MKMNCAKCSFCLGETQIWPPFLLILNQNTQFLLSKNRKVNFMECLFFFQGRARPTECAGSAEPLKEAIRDSGIGFRIRYDKAIDALVLINFQAVI